MRGTVVFLLILVFSCSAMSLSISTDRSSYVKGDSIIITGSSTGGPIVISILNGPRGIYQTTVQSSGPFSASYRINAIDPKGAWEIIASQGNEKKSISISVKPTREGAFYRVVFTSPPYEEIEYARTETVPLSISVLDAGKPVVGANLRVFTGASELRVIETSPGVYQGDYEIPFNAKIGASEIYAIAEKAEGEKSFGGESEGPLKIEVKEAPLQIEFVSPTSGPYKVGETIPIQVKISYSTGKPVQDPSISMKANELLLPLESNGDVYSSTYQVRENDSGILALSVKASDPAGNSGSAYKNIEVKGIAVQAVTDYYWYLVIGGILLLAVLAFVAKNFLSRSSLEKLEREREDILAMEKGLQEDYIKKGTIDRETFQKRMTSYETMLTDLDEKIKRKKGKK